MTPPATTLWCEWAWLGGPVASPGVTLVVDEGRFVAVVPLTEPPDEAAIVAGLALPGLANAHSHAFHRALRARSQRGRGDFWTWREEMYRVAGGLDPDRLRELAAATFGEMVLAGVTAVGEFHYVHHEPEGRPYADPNAMGLAVVEAAADAGLRLTLLDTCYLAGGIDRPVEGVQRRFSDGTVQAWAERVDALSVPEHARVGAAVHSVRAVPPEAIAEVAAWAAERGAPLHVHVAEQPAEVEASLEAFGRTPVEVLHDAGALGPSSTAVHATHLTEIDLARLGGSGSAVCLCPTTERDLADGVAPAEAMVRAGARLVVGSDSHAVIDLFEEVRAIELDERLVTGRRGVHPPSSLLRATVGGHRALGWPDAGRLVAGHRADLVVLDLDSVRLAGTPPADLVTAAVFAASAVDVRHVMVDGRWIVRDGAHLSFDVPAALAKALAEA